MTNEGKRGARSRETLGVVAAVLIVVLAVFVGLLCMPARALAEGATFQVSTSDEYAAAVDRINAAESGEFAIELTQDVSLGGDYRISKNSVTIVGGGHALSGGGNATVFAEGTATVCLGAQDGSDTLTIKGGSSVPAGTMVSVGGSAKVEMCAGVTITGHGTFGSDAAVSLSGNATFEMFGGKISDCKDLIGGVTGGVGVGSASDDSSDSCTFKMHAGSIENCSGGYGAGVRVGRGGTFVMDSAATISGCTSSSWGGGVYADQAKLVDIQGTIKNNSATYGGGVSVTYMKYSLTSFFPRKVLLSGATITGNKATYGGGVSLYNATTANAVSNCTITGNEATVGGGVILWSNSEADFSGVGNKVCNNTATSGAADVFLNKAEDTLKLFDAAAMGETYRDTNEEIDGWYIDDPSYVPVENAEAVDVAGKLAGEKALVASYKVTPKATVTIDLGDGSDVSTTIVTSGSTIGKPADPAREGYRFTGWYAEGSDMPLDFGQPVTSDLLIRVHWVRVFTVAFYYGDGRGLGVGIDQGSSVSAPADPVREGYRFLGWYADGSDAKFDFEAPVTSDVKLVAKWEKEGSAVDPSNPGGKDDPAKLGKDPSGSDDPGKPGDSGKGDKPGNGLNSGDTDDSDNRPKGDKPANGGVDDSSREQVEMMEQAASSELPPTGDAVLSVAAGLFAAVAVVAISLAAIRRRA